MIVLSYVLVLAFHFSRISLAIRYGVMKSSHETAYYDRVMISSESQARKITILEDIPVIKKDTVKIREKTSVFVVNHRRLGKIEAGAFVDQALSQAIILTNNRLRKISKGTFRNLKIFELLLNNNRIEDVEREAIVDMPNLHIINLAHNKIFYLEIPWAVDTPRMSSLDLSFNNLRTLHRKVFNFLNNGEKVTILLDYNKVNTVCNGAFNGIRLDTLNLANNKFSMLPKEIFRGGTLTRIFLENNILEDLPLKFFDLVALREADFNGNSLDCRTQKRLAKMARGTTARIAYDITNCC